MWTNETSGGGGSYNKEPPLFFCVENEDVLIFLKEGYRNPTGFMIIPELSEPPVRTLGAEKSGKERYGRVTELRKFGQSWDFDTRRKSL